MKIHEIINGAVYSLKEVSPDARVLCKDSVCTGAKKNTADNTVPVVSVAPILYGCRITFGLMNRKAMTFSVPETVYESINVGSVGQLEFTGKRFENFVMNTAD